MEQKRLTDSELDAIGEIMNISMGAAATAVSSMLEKQVTITTPRLEQERFKDVDCSALEPAIIVRIKYVEGLEGTNVIMLRRHDMQVILNLLMGNEIGVESDNFEFDEMSMSAACEVMNQMMGASATALSEILNKPVNISTPEAMLADRAEDINAAFSEIRGEDQVVAISFKMMIKDVMDTTFSCFMPVALTSKIINSAMPGWEEEETAAARPEGPASEAAQPQAADGSSEQPPLPPAWPAVQSKPAAFPESAGTGGQTAETMEQNASAPAASQASAPPEMNRSGTPVQPQAAPQPQAAAYGQGGGQVPPYPPDSQSPIRPRGTPGEMPAYPPQPGLPPYGQPAYPMPPNGQYMPPYFNPYMQAPMGYGPGPYGYPLPPQGEQPAGEVSRRQSAKAGGDDKPAQPAGDNQESQVPGLFPSGYGGAAQRGQYGTFDGRSPGGLCGHRPGPAQDQGYFGIWSGHCSRAG